MKHDESFDLKDSFEHYRKKWHTEKLIIKPAQDGCSAGVAILANKQDATYFQDVIQNGQAYIEGQTLSCQECQIDLPLSSKTTWLLEPCIEVTKILYQDGNFIKINDNGCYELTVTVIENQGTYKSLDPLVL